MALYRIMSCLNKTLITSDNKATIVCIFRLNTK